jgi:two-component system sensor histidine kinase RpfC
MQGTPEKSKRVLLVDDDLIVVRAMEKILRRSGFVPVGCKDGNDALSKLDAGFDAAVVDIHLPDMSGLTLAQQFRERIGPNMPIVILSGDTSIETLRALPEAGATHFFSKPVQTGVLIERLREWCGA